MTSFESICSIPTCPSSTFSALYEDDNISTQSLCDTAYGTIARYSQDLCAAGAGHRYRLDELLSGMLMHAPHPLGKRYVAVSLYIASQKGGDAVVDIARSWMENLFLPMLIISKETKGLRYPGYDPFTGEAERPEDPELEELRKKVALRERYLCAITQTFDLDCAAKLLEAGKGDKIPADITRRRMNASYIISDIFLKLISNKDETEATAHQQDRRARFPCILEMFQSWTQLDMNDLKLKIHTPFNVIYMTLDENLSFRNFRFYFDGDSTTPHKYKARMVRNSNGFSTGPNTLEVNFRSFDDSDYLMESIQRHDNIDPPDPSLLAVHAAFTKVMNGCGLMFYVRRIQEELENLELQHEGTDGDLLSTLLRKLDIGV
ncbi:hypothetical protein VKT23_010048 [Stygiomarasmius scandens]|uniref:HNH nuclease domain-containing protein n=1 Tax=Marasmiellus scandens TaxID=2682957 RepID=A0ABR1JCW2_9AGAR